MTNSEKNRLKDKAFQWFGVACTIFGLLVLAIFIGDIIAEGIARIDWKFLTSYPSKRPEKAGLYSAMMGTLWMLGLTAIIAIPLGIGAGIYFEEYAKKSRLANILEINLANLAGVPSIIYGLLGLEIFVRSMGMGTSLLAGACTLSLLILPIFPEACFCLLPGSEIASSMARGAKRCPASWSRSSTRLLTVSAID